MRFLRHLLAVLAVIAVIIGLGYLWKASPAASLISNGGGHDAGRQFAPPRGNPSDQGGRNLDGGFALGRVDDLAQTVIEVALIFGAVVLIDQARRRRGTSRIDYAAITRASTPPAPTSSDPRP